MRTKEVNYSKEFIAKANSLRDEHSKEDVLRYNFVSYLKLMYPPDTKWIRDHIDGSEHSLTLSRGSREVTGFVDSCLDSIAIEYEKDLRNITIYNEGLRQVKEYCAALVRKGVDISLISGVLSDTVSWHIFSVEETDGLSSAEYNQDNIRLKKIDSLDCSTATTETATQLIYFLSKHIGRIGSRFVTGRNLSKDFGLSSPFSARYIEDISKYISERRREKPEYYDMVQNLWRNFIEFTDNSISSDENYISEYYISTIGKLLCANFIEKRALASNDNELLQIINGSFFENRGYYNFVEYDYFGWLNNDSSVVKLLPTLHCIQNEMIIYDFSTKPKEDVFGEIMVQMSERSQRILLGQELTPQWLASLLVQKVSSMLPNATKPCFIDMCCGSGSMLIETLKTVISTLPDDASPKEIQNSLTSAITGFDIDPLAIILAKINWIITVNDTITEHNIDKISVPIYHADSLFINTPVTQGLISNNAIQRMQLHDCYVDLPMFLIEDSSQAIFDKIVDACYDSLSSEDFYPDVITGRCSQIIQQYNPDISKEHNDSTIRFAVDLCKQMHTLNKRGQNGLWSFLIKNSFRPNLIGAHFNGIVSNTPWLSMSKLSSNPYKQELSRIAKYYNIKPSGSSFLHLEMATIFLIHSVDKFLMHKAAFGCILPETVLSGKHHEEFRVGHYRKGEIPFEMGITEIWNLPVDTFKNRAIAIFGRKENIPRLGKFTGKTIESSREFIEKDFNVFTGHNRTVWSQSELSDKHGVFDAYDFEQGADILPRYLTFFNITNKGEKNEITSIDQNGEHAYFLADMHKGKDYLLPRSLVSKTLFFPVVVSKLILPYHVSKFAKAFLPIKRAERWERLEEKDILLMDRTDQNIILTIQEEYQKSFKGNDFFTDSINYRNKLSNQDFKKNGFLVLYCAGGKNVCGAYLNLNKLEEVPIIDQTVYWCVVSDESEAIFMTGLLNCEELTNSISAFQPHGAFGERHIHTLAATSLPAYNSSDTSHQEVVRATKNLISELNNKIETNQDITNPLKGSMVNRRKKIRDILKELPSYISYVEACNNVL